MMEHFFLAWAYKWIQKRARWLPDPETERGKNQIKIILVTFWLVVLIFSVIIVAKKPQTISNFAFIKGKINSISFYENIVAGHHYKQVDFRLAEKNGGYKFYYENRDLIKNKQPHIDDTIEAGLLKSEIIKNDGGTVREIRFQGDTLGGIGNYIAAEDSARKFMTPIILLAVIIATILLTRKWIQTKEEWEHVAFRGKGNVK